MGADIHGCVEFREAALDRHFDEEDWYSVVDAGIILDRDYSLFGSLFGVRNYTDFAPVAAGRGLPPHVSDEVRGHAECEGHHSDTWVTWDELQAVDWEEETGECRAWADVGGGVRTIRWVSVGDPHCRPGETWSEGGLLFTAERVTRRQAAGDDFVLLMAMMEPLARRYGGQYVRLCQAGGVV